MYFTSTKKTKSGVQIVNENLAGSFPHGQPLTSRGRFRETDTLWVSQPAYRRGNGILFSVRKLTGMTYCSDSESAK